jgi:ABC-2 type transport system ATP-binding protein
MNPVARPDDALLVARGLSRHYGRRRVLHDFDLTLARGDILGLLGQNGAGKSTTLQILTGALAGDGGTVSIGGHDLDREPFAAKRLLGYLPEVPPLYADMRVDEYLDACARLRGIEDSAVAGAVERARARCGLAAVGGRLIGHLSKGYQQRVGLAQAIVHEPPVLILDEPSAGLDPAQIRDLRDLVRELARASAVIVSSHILPEVRALATRLMILHQGRVVHDGPLEETACVRARMRRPPEVAVLAALPGVNAVTAVDDAFLIAGSAPEDIAEALSLRAAASGWGLVELTPAHDDLERLFLELTSAGTEAAA